MATVDVSAPEQGEDIGALLAQLSTVLGGLGIPQGNIDLIMGFVGSNPGMIKQLANGADVSSVAAISGMSSEQLMGIVVDQALEQGSAELQFQNEEQAQSALEQLRQEFGVEVAPDAIEKNADGTVTLNLEQEQLEFLRDQTAAKGADVNAADLGEQEPRPTPQPGDGPEAFIGGQGGREL